MKKFRQWLLFMAVLTACQMKPKDTPLVTDYMPSTQQAYQFDGSGNEYASYTYIPEYSDHGILQFRKINGATELVEVHTFADHTWTKTLEQAETYYRDDLRSFKQIPTEIMLREPIEVGTSWKLADGSTRTITNLNVPLQFMNNSYATLEVTTTSTQKETKHYYAKGLGLVKVIYPDAITSALVRFIDPLLTKQVRYFFPHPSQMQYAYMEAPVTFAVNDSIPKKLEETAKSILQSRFPTLILGTAINHIGMRDDVATIDLSAAFMDDLELVSGQEARIVTSLLMTLGYYYQTSKVVLTVADVPYQSDLLPLPASGYHTIDIFAAEPWVE